VASKRKGASFPIGLIKEVIHKEPIAYSGIRKILQDVTYETTELPQLSYKDLGYTAAKHKQLMRNYVNEEEFARVKAILKKREKQHFTSVAVSMRGATKDSRSMGWCMCSLIITRMSRPKLETVEVQYRSTEIIKKFAGDLAFMPYLFKEFGLNPDVIRFRFANVYFSGVFFPTLCLFWDPVEFLDYLYEHDRKMFEGSTRFFLRSARTPDQIFPYSPENQQHKLAWGRLDMARIHDYLIEKHKDNDKPLPELHQKGEYVTRNEKKKLKEKKK
jgi:hypothetical protein